MSEKAIVLSSGGVDSTTCLGLAVNQYGSENVVSVSIAYGQKHSRELECADAIAKYYNVRHEVLDLSSIFQFSNCSLLKQSSEAIPEGDYEEQVNRDASGKVSTYVPFRNGVMLSTIAALAQSIFPEDKTNIFLGAHADDAAGNAYADCSESFVNSMKDAIYVGTYEKVEVKTPFVSCNKAQVVKKGLELNVPYHLTWSCYAGGDKPCGKCGTCIDRAKAFAANGVSDPALDE